MAKDLVARLISHYPSVLSVTLIAFLSSHTAAETSPFPLWTGSIDLSEKTNAPLVDAPRTIINFGEPGRFQFTLGADIIVHGDTLIAQWGDSLVDENDEGSIVRGSRSTDGGKTWSPPEVIAPGYEGPARHCHGVLHSVDGELWCFVAEHGRGSNRGRYKGLRSEAFQWDDQAKQWQSKGTFGDDGFWPLNSPIRMDNGKWIMAGCLVGRGARAAVAIHDGDHTDWTRWRIIEVPHVDGVDTNSSSTTWAESAVVVQGQRVLLVARNQTFGGLLASTSDDYGETWPALQVTNMPTAPTKPTAGTLRDGRHYLIAQFPGPVRDTRDNYFLALSKPGELTFSQIYRFADGNSAPPRMPGKGKYSQFAYPSACEWNDKLYVVYSVAKEDTGLSVIDLRSLKQAE